MQFSKYSEALFRKLFDKIEQAVRLLDLADPQRKRRGRPPKWIQANKVINQLVLDRSDSK
jgi:hypothetical protein